MGVLPDGGAECHVHQGRDLQLGQQLVLPRGRYQLAVADASKSIKFSSAWATATSRTWNGKAGSETDSPAGSVMAGPAYYQIKFRKAGTAYGGEGYYGQTKWVPITIN